MYVINNTKNKIKSHFEISWTRKENWDKNKINVKF